LMKTWLIKRFGLSFSAVDAGDIESPCGKEPRVLAGAGAEVEETFGRGIAEQ